MTWRALIVDDEAAGRGRLVDLCAQTAELEVAALCEDVVEARAALASHEVDIVFLDIQMPEGDGFELLAGLPIASRPVVIFVTAHASFAVRAFEEEAFDYLLKPYDVERFAKAVRRAIEHLERRREGKLADRIGALLEDRTAGQRRMPIRSAGRVTFLPFEEIEWIDAAGNAVRVHAGGNVHRIRETMGAIQEQLDSPRFARVHRSTIVNLDRVREVLVGVHGDYVVVTDSGQRLAVGRLYRDRVQELLRSRIAT